jgi:AhpD family alkylhydroperoxidase
MARLSMIENPSSLLLRLAYALSRRRYGKVITPLKVIYARKPALARFTVRIQTLLRRDITLPNELVALVHTQSSLLNGCAFCHDLHLAEAVRQRLGREKFATLAEFENSRAFTAREKAALAYTSEVTQTRHASEEAFARLKEHFSETEIVELTWVNAIANYFNMLAIPLGVESDSLLSRVGPESVPSPQRPRGEA